MIVVGDQKKEHQEEAVCVEEIEAKAGTSVYWIGYNLFGFP